MKVLVCGDRNWNDLEMIKTILYVYPKDTIIIEGEARGADTLAREAAEALGLRVMKFPADWARYGRSAGPIRNRQMLNESPNEVLAFHDNLDNSKGTKDCVTEAKKRGIVVKEYKHNQDVAQLG